MAVECIFFSYDIFVDMVLHRTTLYCCVCTDRRHPAALLLVEDKVGLGERMYFRYIIFVLSDLPVAIIAV